MQSENGSWHSNQFATLHDGWSWMSRFVLAMVSKLYDNIKSEYAKFFFLDVQKSMCREICSHHSMVLFVIPRDTLRRDEREKIPKYRDDGSWTIPGVDYSRLTPVLPTVSSYVELSGTKNFCVYPYGRLNTSVRKTVWLSDRAPNILKFSRQHVCKLKKHESTIHAHRESYSRLEVPVRRVVINIRSS